MRRASRILLIALVLAAAAAGVGYWSGSNAPIDVVAEGRRILGTELRSSMVETNGVRLHVVEAGPADGPPVLLLHGFPEFWWGWSGQIARLSRAGFRVIAPDQRGYDLSDKPAGLESYRVEVLTADLIGLLDRLGIERTNLAGHDWGGAIAWRLVLAHPERVRKLAMFNAPHPLAWRDAQGETSDEKSITWFRTVFQLPWIPELMSRSGNWALVLKNMVGTARTGVFSDQDVAFYRQAWARPGAYRAMVNWYRASFRYPPEIEGDGTVRVPTRLVWGMRDAFFEKRMLGMSAAHCADVNVVELPDATHWLLHEEPDATSRAMVEFFREGG
jgi:pimeloyl-ACP methyl ester carboxylesterase